MFWVGLGVVFVLGVAVIGYGAWSDRPKADRVRRPRPVPGVEDSPQPTYLTADEVRAAPPVREEAPDLTLADATAVAARPESPAYATTPDPGANDPWLVLDDAWVIVFATPPAEPRELVGLLARHRDEAVLIACTGLPGPLVELLEVNVRRSGLRLASVAMADAELAALAGATGATPITRAQLQADYVPRSRLGRVRRLAVTAESVWLWT